MFNQHKNLLKSILGEGTDIASPIPGEAPSAVSTDPLITEPTNPQGADIYSLYPDLADVDISSPCNLVDYFSSLCDAEAENAEYEKQVEMVPSLGQQDTESEF